MRPRPIRRASAPGDEGYRLIDGLVRLMDSRASFTGPVNLGNEGEFSIRELGELVLAETGSSSKLVNLPLPRDDPRQRRPDTSLAKTELGWQPIVRLQDGEADRCIFSPRPRTPIPQTGGATSGRRLSLNGNS